MILYQCLLTAVLLVCLSYSQSRPPVVVDAFQKHVVVARHHLLPPSAATACSALEMAAKGMGGGMMAKKKKKAKGPTAAAAKKGLQKNRNGKTQSQPFNVNASLLRLEKNYDDLARAAAKNLRKERHEDDDDNDDIVTTEYVVAARAHGYVSDWVPVAQICLARPASLVHEGDGVSDPLVRAAVSCYCRELSLVASQGARVFQSVPRNLMQYAVETEDSFHKHVICAVEDDPRASSKNGSRGKQDGEPSTTKMTKQEARQVLQLPDGTSTTDDKSEIKQAYRKLSFQFHPDRFARGAAAAATAEQSQAQVQESADQYTRIQLAYETLTSGLRGASSSLSWYESLGGRARSTDFLGPIELWPLAKAQDILQQQAALVESAVVGLDPDLVQGFVTRANSQQS